MEYNYNNVIVQPNMDTDNKNDPRNLPKYDWLQTAKIYNFDFQVVPNDWFVKGMDVIVLYFSVLDADRDGIIEQFYEIYENAKYVNMPIQVLNIPLDDTVEDMYMSYMNQANWFTLLHNTPLISILRHMYGITSVPCLVVIKPNGDIVSIRGILDLDAFGKSALISWLTFSPEKDLPKRLNADRTMYGRHWRYLTANLSKGECYKRKFTLKPSSSQRSLHSIMNIQSNLSMVKGMVLAESMTFQSTTSF